jgi:hypothetical protein
VRPLSRDRSAPCELHPPDVVVANGGAESRDHLAGPSHQLD